MAKPQIDELITAIRGDATLLREFSGVPHEPQSFISKLLEIGRRQGYDFTEDEARTWYVERGQAKENGELSDTALDAVAGGASGFPDVFIAPGGIPLPVPNIRR